MSNKRYDQFGAVTPTNSRITLTADPSTGTLGKTSVSDLLSLVHNDYNLLNYLIGLGSSIRSMFFPYPWSSGLTSFSPNNQTLWMMPVYLNAGTHTGIWYSLVAAFVGTGSNYNGFGLFSYSGGTCTLIAQTTNSITQFQGTTGSFRTSAFASPYFANAGTYYIGVLISWSAATAAASLQASGSSGSIQFITNLGLPSNRSFMFIDASHTSLPGTINLPTTIAFLPTLPLLGTYE